MALALALLGGCASAPPPVADPAPNVESSAADAAAPAPAAPVVPERASQQFAEALAHLQAGRNTDAELELRQLELAYPQFAAPSINLGLLYQRAGKLEQAAQSLEEAVRRDPANALSQTELGLVYRRLGRFQAAHSAYESALQADPNYAPAHLNLGVLCDLFLQDPQRALQAFEQYQALSGNSDKRVANWIAELKGRLGSNSTSQTAESPQ